MLRQTMTNWLSQGSKKVSLRLVLVVPFVIQIVTALVLTGYLSFHNGQRGVNDLAIQLQSEVSDRIEQYLNVYLSTPHQINQINVDAAELGLLNLSDLQTTGQYFWQQMQVFEVSSISFSNEKGEFIGVERLEDGTLQINEVSNQTHPGQLYSYETDSQGKRTHLIAVKDWNPRVEAWYTETVKAGQPLWNQRYQWQDPLEVLSIAATYPVYDTTKRLVGVLRVDPILTPIRDFLDDLSPSQSGQTFILERNGFLVAHSQPKSSEAGLESPSPRHSELLNSSILHSFQHRQHLRFKSNGICQFVQVTPFSDPFGLDWLIVVMVPESDLMAHTNTNILLLCLGALGLTAVLGILTSGWIRQPILRLSEASQALVQGDLTSEEFDAILHLKGIQELEVLVQSFSQLAGQQRESLIRLAKTHEELEWRVEQRTAELETAESEWRRLFEAMTELIFVKDAQGRYLKIVSTNPGILYQPTVEMLGKTDYEVFPRSQADTFVSYIQQALDTKQTVKIEYSLTLNQQEVWFAATISPISSDSVLWVARDITDRKQALEALRASEAQYRDLVETPNCIILRWNAEGQIKFMNQYGQQFFGYEENQILGRNIVGTLVPDTERSQRILNVLIQGICKRPKRYQLREIENIRSNGEQVWVTWANKPILDDSGQLVEVLSIGTDATDRKRAEEALKEKEQYLRLVLDNIPQQVFWKDTNLVFLGCNKNWAQAAQLESPEAVVGKTDYDLLPSREIADLYRSLDRRVIETNQAEFNLVESKQKPPVDGRTVWLDVSKIPIHDSKGKVIGILGVLEDITERKYAEEQRKQAEADLRAEQEKSERLLLNILPEAIAQQLKQNHSTLGKYNGEALIAEQFEDVTILFADIVGFTPLSTRMSPTALVNLLNQIISTFDRLSEQYGLEKIKTIGDAYMVACGLPVPRSDHAEAIAQMALDMQRVISQFLTDKGEPFQIRIGINTGPVVAGVIGMKKFIYDLWGDTVNVASRMESQGIPGGIQVTQTTYERLKQKYVLEKRGAIAVKGKGKMVTYWLTSQLDPKKD